MYTISCICLNKPSAGQMKYPYFPRSAVLVLGLAFYVLAHDRVTVGEFGQLPPGNTFMNSLLDFWGSDVRGPSWMSYVKYEFLILSECNQKSSARPSWCTSYGSVLSHVLQELRSLVTSRHTSVNESCTWSYFYSRFLFHFIPFGTVKYAGGFNAASVQWNIAVNPVYALNTTLFYFESISEKTCICAFLHLHLQPAVVTSHKSDDSNAVYQCGVYRQPNTKIWRIHKLLTLFYSNKCECTDILFMLQYDLIEDLPPFPVYYAMFAMKSLHNVLDLIRIPFEQVQDVEYPFMSDKTTVMVGRPYVCIMVRITAPIMHQITLSVLMEGSRLSSHIGLSFFHGRLNINDIIPESGLRFIITNNRLATQNITSILNLATLVLWGNLDLITNYTLVVRYHKTICPGSYCKLQKRTMIPGNLDRIAVKSDMPEIYNFTYYIPPAYQDSSLAINITSFTLDAPNVGDLEQSSRVCDYGGLIMTYQEHEHTIHLPIAIICDQMSINRLLDIAQPLYLGRGSLSVILRNYGYRLQFSFVVFTSGCRGIVASHVLLSHMPHRWPCQSGNCSRLQETCNTIMCWRYPEYMNEKVWH